MLRDVIQKALQDAMREKDVCSLAAIRMVLAGIKNQDVVARGKGEKEASEADIWSIMQTMIKQRKESSKIYVDANRLELAKKEDDEIVVIEKFLPKQLSEDEIVLLVKSIIEKTGASSMKDMGKIMAELRESYAGQLDFSIASEKIKSLLG